MRYYPNPNRFVATIEEKNSAASLRKNMIGWVETVSEHLPDDVADMFKWMICRVGEESIIRKQRRAEVERWFEEAISQLEPGTTFTQRGLLEEFDARETVWNYAPFILSEWANNRHLIKLTSRSTRGLMATAAKVNVYEVL